MCGYSWIHFGRFIIVKLGHNSYYVKVLNSWVMRFEFGIVGL